MPASSITPGASLQTAQAAGINGGEAVAYFSVTLAGEVQLAATKTEAAVDLGAPGVLSAKLDVTTITGTTPTLDVVLQDSFDNGVTDAYATITGGTFTQATTAATNQRKTVVCKRWVRAVATIAGTTPKYDFTVIGEIKR